MKNAIIIFHLIFLHITFGQSSTEEIESLNGIWIAKDYYDSFEKTKSAVKSKYAFEHDYPVALRINSKEIKNGIFTEFAFSFSPVLCWPEKNINYKFEKHC